jgi:hypothetical protein
VRRPRRGVRRNGFFDSLLGRENWGYAFYGNDARKMFQGTGDAHTKDEAKAVAYFGWERVPGVQIAIAYDRARWTHPPNHWTQDWQVAAYDGIDGMSVWMHDLSMPGRVTEPRTLPARAGRSQRTMRMNASRAALDGSPEAAAILSSGRRVFIVRGLATHGTLRSMKKQVLPTLVIQSPSEAAAKSFAKQAYKKSLQRGTEVDLQVEAV